MQADRGASDRGPDPQWGQVLAIRMRLEIYGKYVAEVDPRHTQALLDIHEAALQAGRLLGVGVKVDLSSQNGQYDSVMTATVSCVEADSPQRAQAREGLQRLLQSVREAQRTASRVPADVPRPRRPPAR